MAGDRTDRAAPGPGEVALRRLADVIDGHRWDDLADVLTDDFSCLLVHTGERFDRDGWVRFNRDYPGFERFVLEDCVGDGDRAVGRSSVTGRDGCVVERFAVASFVTVRGERIVDLVEVWADVADAPPVGRRPVA